ncbi:MAG: DUF2299 domain-containing protein [Thermoprotei archaeon]
MSDQLSQKVTQWLQEAGLAVSKTQNVQDYFNITVSPPPPMQGPVLTVSRPKAESSFFAVGMGITIHPTHLSKLNTEPRNERLNFLNSLKYTYLTMNIDFVFIPPQNEVPQHIQLVKLVFIDGLTQNELFNTYTLVRNAGILTIMRFVEKFGNVDQNQPTGIA